MQRRGKDVICPDGRRVAVDRLQRIGAGRLIEDHEAHVRVECLLSIESQPSNLPRTNLSYIISSNTAA